MRFHYNVIVIGAGHAGCEAAVASAKLGSSTLLLTGDLNRVAHMSCNPAIGGIAKGQIVREIDALGGMMGIIADKSAIQFRMLNRSKGPAVWSPRAQSDRVRYSEFWKMTLESTPNLFLYQDMAVELLFDSNEGQLSVKGVRTAVGIEFFAKKLILTAGTFLNGLMHFGQHTEKGGRIGEPASVGITEQLSSIGFRVDRMKTGTPVRIDGRSIDYSLVTPQDGDDRVEDGNIYRDFHKFSFLPSVQRELRVRQCFMTHTNGESHDVMRRNLDKSPLYNGAIKSIGPRYCPSIETKIVTFSDKESHQLFLEPEGEFTEEFYVNGFSSSLPFDVQLESLQKIPALRNVHLYRPGYAIEYDFFDPTQLTSDLQTRQVEGLYFAGQVNGTTGYEEAAAQGLIAGINAARSVKSLPPVVIHRDQGYIGVLIDDLVTKGVDEPYRMFTSRAEYRILLRQDDADMRLTQLGYDIGLASKDRYDLMCAKREVRDKLIEFCKEIKVSASDSVNSALKSFGTSPLSHGVKLIELVRRPQLSIFDIASFFGPLMRFIETVDKERCDEIVEAAEILIKYEGYIEREAALAEKAKRLDNVRLSDTFDYMSVSALSTEARQKLTALRPANIGQASRIPGVSPADINVLLVLLGR